MEPLTLRGDGALGLLAVSLPCLEWFTEQPQSYREKLLPPSITALLSVEAGVATGWREIVGCDGEIVSIDHFRASADTATLYQKFGFTSEAVARRTRSSSRWHARNTTGTDVGHGMADPPTARQISLAGATRRWSGTVERRARTISDRFAQALNRFVCSRP